MSEQPEINGKNGLRNGENTMESANIIYSHLENAGLNYVKKQKNYLVISAVFPIYAIIIQIINLIFIIQLEAMKPPIGPNPGGPDIFDITSPILIFLVISVFTLINSGFLIKWRNLVNYYEKYGKNLDKMPSSREEDDNPTRIVSLTQIFYDIVKTMERIRILFVILVIFCLYNSFWFFRFFFFRLDQIAPIHPPPIQQQFTAFLNLLSQVSLVIFLLFQWRHLHQWNKKLRELKTFERKIYEELDS